jgi:glycerol kinase
MQYLGAVDQGTTSTRFIIFDRGGAIVASHQLEHTQIFPRPGWVEHDPMEIWANTQRCITEALKKARLKGRDLSGIGITNQRETIVAWEKESGKVYHNAIVWQDLRTSAYIEELKDSPQGPIIEEKTGLVLSPYFGGSKIAWLLEHVDGLREDAESGKAVFGTIDSWLAYQFSGKTLHITDASNASRYLLMNIETLSWDDELLEIFSIPKGSLPMIVPSSGMVYGHTAKDGPFGSEVPIAGILGDQQAALFGQACFKPGTGKSTYGTGCFLLVNTGFSLPRSRNGLLTTVAYRIGDEKPVYALEGSVAVAGSLVQWARDNLKLVESAQQLDREALTVTDSGGVYVVPAFSGLFAPYWRSDARGVIAGLTAFVTKAHLCRAILESTAFQAYDIFKAMESDSGIKTTELKVDGGMTNSEPLMEFQADLLGVPVIRPQVVETTALGAAFAAGLSVGVYKDLDELASYWKERKRWESAMDDETRDEKVRFWKKAVERTLEWV